MSAPFETLAGAIEQLYLWQHRNTSSFCNGLCTLHQKADPYNRERLRRGFPFITAAFDLWNAAPDSDEFFIQQGFKIP